MPRILALISRLLPGLGPIAVQEKLRASLGALIGVGVAGLLSRWALGTDASVPMLIAPMGASAVLLFAVPASPLAQPWSIIGGNAVSALIGVACARLLPDPVLAAGLAIGLSIGAMLMLRCLHPPSGAVALTAVLGGPAVHEAGFAFVLSPVGLNSVLLLAAAIAYNNLTGRRYPHLAAPAPARDAGPAPAARAGVSAAEIDALLQRYGEVLDIGRDDLAALVNAAQIDAYRRGAGGTVCADIMTRRIVAASPDTPLHDAWSLLHTHRIRALPVTDESARIVGIVTQTDFLDHAEWGPAGPRIGLVRRLRRLARLETAPEATVGMIMTRGVRTVTADTRIADLVPLMADAGVHQLPVVDGRRQLAGIVTQSDLIGALFRAGLAERGLQVEEAAPQGS